MELSHFQDQSTVHKLQVVPNLQRFKEHISRFRTHLLRSILIPNIKADKQTKKFQMMTHQ